MNFMKTLAAAAVAAPLAFAATPSHAVNVGLELALLIDVSGSVDDSEFALQRDGYVNAFNSLAVQSAIANSVGGAIAVTLIQWSGSGQQQQSVGWTLINDATSASAFATAVAGINRITNNLTAPGSAINFTLPLFGNETGGLVDNGFTSQRQVIDVSGDGPQNDGDDTAAARNAALAAGVDAINGLAIGDAGLLAWYQANIVGGAGSFAIQAANFSDFAGAIQNKLVREITGEVPAPATLVLFGAALLGLAGLRRKA